MSNVQYTSADAVCGISITQIDHRCYDWHYSQEGAIGSVPRGTAKSVAQAIAQGLPVAREESKTQGGSLLSICLKMVDGRRACGFTPAANQTSTADEVAEKIVAMLK